jgi:hypothetical protein
MLVGLYLEGFDDSESFKSFAAKRHNDPIYGSALQRLQTHSPKTTKCFEDDLNNTLPYYFAALTPPWFQFLQAT